jgi:hypothetical protein
MTSDVAAGTPPQLATAYHRTCYRVGGVSVRIGHRSDAADRLLACNGARSAVFITAWNPRSQRMPERWNRRMQRALAGRLRRRPVLQAEGAWRRWREAHLLVLADPRPVTVLARRFRQNAVVVLRRRAPAVLVWV